MNEREKEILIEGAEQVLEGRVNCFIGYGYIVSRDILGSPWVVDRKAYEHSFGHGWVEYTSHRTASQLKPDVEIEECVWIQGWILRKCDDGSAINIGEDYGIWLHDEEDDEDFGYRIWTGIMPPTKQQCLDTRWN